MKFCPECGHMLEQTQWPRTCEACKTIHYRNPKAVAVAMVPVEQDGKIIGLVGVKRRGGPWDGQWALPGGFVDWGEDGCIAAARELLEETGFALDHKSFQLSHDAKSRDGATLLLFAKGPAISIQTLALAVPCPTECWEVGVLGLDAAVAFPTHGQALNGFLAEQA